MLRTLGLAHAGSVREVSVSGDVTVAPFGPRRVTVARAVAQVEPTVLTPRPDVGDLAAEALGGLPRFRAPDWDAVARHLSRSHCPFLALALVDAGLVSARAARPVTTSALAAMRTPPTRRTARTPTPTPAPEPAAVPAETAEPAEPPAPSCDALCRMHMVELCNQDRALWDSHRRRWEPTPCGAMRDETFLKDCYRQQWLSGAFHDACVVPCESGEGRARLLDILHDGGCLKRSRS